MEDSYCKIVVVNAFLRLRFHAIMVVVYGVMKRPKSESQPCMIDFSKKILKIIMKFTNYFANILNHFQNDYLSLQVVTIVFIKALQFKTSFELWFKQPSTMKKD